MYRDVKRSEPTETRSGSENAQEVEALIQIPVCLA